ncbi:MAG TPA: class I SAM-dependent methyltransferase [Chryseosolibacter sp.]|nr:class I SAM-dependent methyltransferase [Chryseosolibacter sp.]
MDVRQSYDLWAEDYDSVDNKTRDLEGLALRDALEKIEFDTCLEIGCGTGKNTQWLAARAKKVTAVDFSEQMLAMARKKIDSGNVLFQQADITRPWTFTSEKYPLITFSLVLEHVEQLEPVLIEAERRLSTGGHIYVGELHPFKQYTGTKARFDTVGGQHVIACFNHHVSDFIRAAKTAALRLEDAEEYFDGNDRGTIPRILAMIFRKQG